MLFYKYKPKACYVPKRMLRPVSSRFNENFFLTFLALPSRKKVNHLFPEFASQIKIKCEIKNSIFRSYNRLILMKSKSQLFVFSFRRTINLVSLFFIGMQRVRIV